MKNEIQIIVILIIFSLLLFMVYYIDNIGNSSIKENVKVNIGNSKSVGEGQNAGGVL